MRVCKHSLALRQVVKYGGLVGLTLLFGAGVFMAAHVHAFPRFAPPNSVKQQVTPSPAADVDTDGDGLSDFQEIHKYFTNPHKKDTARKGIADGSGTEHSG